MRDAYTPSSLITARRSQADLIMDQFDDDINRLASAGLSRRRSSAVCLPPYTSIGDSRTGASCIDEVTMYRVLVLEASKVGKTAFTVTF